MTAPTPNQYPQTVYYAPAQPNYQTPQAPEKTYREYRRRLWLGGWFGLHHYYTGNVARGILYTCTCPFGLSFIGWFKDLFGSRRKFNQEMASQGILSARHRG